MIIGVDLMSHGLKDSLNIFIGNMTLNITFISNMTPDLVIY